MGLFEMICVLISRDLDAASSLINPERRDSLLLSLNKKVELLDRKLQEAETEHARKLALGMKSRCLQE